MFKLYIMVTVSLKLIKQKWKQKIWNLGNYSLVLRS